MNKAQLEAALSRTTSQNPISEATLALKLARSIKDVRDELVGMLSGREVMCCKITKGGCEKVVWWATGIVVPCNYNQTTKAKKAAAKRAAQSTIDDELCRT